MAKDPIFMNGPLLVLVVVCVSSHQPILTFTLGTGVDVKTCQYFKIKFRQECTAVAHILGHRRKIDPF